MKVFINDITPNNQTKYLKHSYIKPDIELRMGLLTSVIMKLTEGTLMTMQTRHSAKGWILRLRLPPHQLSTMKQLVKYYFSKIPVFIF